MKYEAVLESPSSKICYSGFTSEQILHAELIYYYAGGGRAVILKSRHIQTDAIVSRGTLRALKVAAYEKADELYREYPFSVRWWDNMIKIRFGMACGLVTSFMSTFIGQMALNQSPTKVIAMSACVPLAIAVLIAVVVAITTYIVDRE